MSDTLPAIDSNHPPESATPSWWRRLLGRLCAYETMSGNGRCPVYLERWTLLKLFGCALYLHHFLGDDWAADPHDHPRRFVTIGLWGWYWEDVYQPHDFECPHPQCYEGWLHSDEDVTCDGPCRVCGPTTKRYSAPWFRTFPASHLHRVRAAECGNTWTLVLVLPKSRPWGFVQSGAWIPWKRYTFGKEARKSC